MVARNSCVAPSQFSHTTLHLELSYVNACFGKEPECAVIEWIVQVVDDLADSRVDDHFCAHETRCECRVDQGILQRHSMIGRLNDSVFFSMRTEAFIQICS